MAKIRQAWKRYGGKACGCVALAVLFAVFSVPATWAGELSVFAAASLKEALEDVSIDYHQATGNTAVVSLAGTSVLARQIQHGAPADVFISANEEWMDVLEAGGLVEPRSRFDLAGNSLVLVTGDSKFEPFKLGANTDLDGMLGDGRLAMALVEAVPAGIYGRVALQSLGLWAAVENRIAQADNVRAALALVASGEAPLGVVYASDAAADERVKVLAIFPEDSHPPIVYPAASITASANRLKVEYLDFLRGPASRAAFKRRGFVVTDE